MMQGTSSHHSSNRSLDDGLEDKKVKKALKKVGDYVLGDVLGEGDEMLPHADVSDPSLKEHKGKFVKVCS